MKNSYQQQLSKQILNQKYRYVFTYFLSKPITEILQNKHIHHVQLFKEFLFYDDEDEYLTAYQQNNAKQVIKASVKSKYQPMLKDLNAYNKISYLFQIEEPELSSFQPSSIKYQSQQVKCQPQTTNQPELEEKDYIPGQQGSLAYDLAKHEEVVSFETTNFDIYEPLYSSQNSSASPIKFKQHLIPQKQKNNQRTSTTMEFPSYVTNDQRRQKSNVYTQGSNKKSFDTIGSTHNSTNVTKKLDSNLNLLINTHILSNSKKVKLVQNKSEKQFFSSIKEVNPAKKPQQVKEVQTLSKNTSFKNILNLQIFEKKEKSTLQNTKISSQSMSKINSLQNSTAFLPKQKKIILSVDEFILQLQNEDILEDNQSKEVSINKKDYHREMIMMKDPHNQKIHRDKIKSPVSSSALFQKLSECFKDQQKNKPSQDKPKQQLRDQQSSLQSLLKRYQQLLLKSPVRNKQVSMINDLPAQTKIRINGKLTSSLTLSSQSDVPLDQQQSSNIKSKCQQRKVNQKKDVLSPVQYQKLLFK